MRRPLLTFASLLLLATPITALADSSYCKSDPLFNEPPLAQGEYEEHVLSVLNELLKNNAYLSVPTQDARMYRILAETTNAQHIVEIGTSTGYSAIWFGLALKKTGGRLTTFEIDPQRAATARKYIKRAQMDGIITLIEGDAHKEVLKLKDPIDILFLDADKKGYIDYLEKLLPLVRPGGLIIGDNIITTMADQKFVNAITTNPQLETITLGGVSYTLKKR